MIYLKKYFFLIAIGLLLSLGLIIFIIDQSHHPYDYRIIEDEFDYEYGESVDLIVNDIVEFKDDKYQGTILNLSLPSNNNNYPDIGEYIGTITIDEHVIEFIVRISDTTAPKVLNYEPISIPLDYQGDYQEFIQIEELSPYTYEIDQSRIDTTKNGSYQTTINVVDSSGNSTTQNITIVVS